MTDVPGCLWFASHQFILIARGAATEPFSVFLDPPGRMLGELLSRGQGAVLPLGASPVEPFRITVRERRRGPIAGGASFLPGPPLGARTSGANRLAWTAGVWRRVDLHALAWGENGLSFLGALQAPAEQGGCRLPPEWCQDHCEILLTPYSENQVQGASETIRSAGGPCLELRRCLAGAGLDRPSPGGAALQRLCRLPAPVLDALCRGLIPFGKNRVPLQDSVCKRLGWMASPEGFVRAYEQSPGLVHLFMDQPRLAKLAAAHGLPGGDGPVTSAALLARAAGDPALERILEDAGSTETEFWVRRLYDGPMTPALRRLRVERLAPVTAEEAGELEPLLDRLQAETLEAVAEELTPGVSSPLHAAAEAAERAREAALRIPTSAAALRTADAALAHLRHQLRLHLEQLVAERPGRPWADLGALLAGLGNAQSLGETCADLRRLRLLEAEEAPTPTAAPPCLLRLDAAWLQRRGRDLRLVRRAAAWCRRLLVDAQSVALADVAAEEDPNVLPSLWNEWNNGWNNKTLQQLLALFPVADAIPERRQLDGRMAEVRDGLPAATDCPEAEAVRETLEAMAGVANRLIVWLQQGKWRNDILNRLRELDKALRCPEVRGPGDDLLRRAHEALADSVKRWGAVAACVEELTSWDERERAAERRWDEQFGRLPAPLRERLKQGGIDAGEHGLGPVVASVSGSGPRVDAELQADLDAARARLRRLQELAARLTIQAPSNGWAEAPAGEPEEASPLAAPCFRLVAAWARRWQECERLQEQATRLRGELTRALDARLAGFLRPAAGAGMEPNESARMCAERGRAAAVLGALVDAGDAAGLSQALDRLDRVAAALTARADLLGLDHPLTAADLAAAPLADRWVLHAADAALVEYLRRLGALPSDPTVLLTSETALETIEAALAGATDGRPRRWWVRLRQELAESLRGRLAAAADLPNLDPSWRPPHVVKPDDLTAVLAWLRRVTQAGAAVALPLRRALAEADLLNDGGGA